MRKTQFTVVLLIALAAVPAAAQNTFRQEVVVTAAAVPVELGTVTRTLTVITRDQIARLPVQSVADVLRLTGAVDVRARGVRGVQTDFAIRGATFGQVLVLVDGVRLNDAQSGHHNGDIPVPLDAVERIEVLHGPGSSLFGADAFGGTINVITRRDAVPASGSIQTGSFGLVAGRGQVGAGHGDVRETLAVSLDRSSGFMVERGFVTGGVSSRTTIGRRGSVLASFVGKDFGANGFYGNAPSHEWTNQTLLAADQRLGSWAGWRVDSTLSYRTHGDHFIFDVRRPSLSENRHRTHAVLGALRASRGVGSRASLTAGVEGGGDWVRSTNLGDHTVSRASAFGEWRYAVRADTQLDASLRLDRYSEFGSAWSPALGIGWWPASSLRLRASTGRAFRVPTFTERFYSDPANWARSEVGAEAAWAGEGGADVFLSNDWTLSATLFGRADSDVIDWLRPTTAERWRTYNIRDVNTVGAELSARRTFPDGSFMQAGYTVLDVEAAAVTQLSKYVLDYAPHSVALAASVALPGALQLAPRLEYKHRTRSTGTSDYALVDLRVSRRFGLYEVRVEGTNLGGASYQEIVGVAMPGRAVTLSLAVRP
ncbi:MAG: TonB-dependent receptor [Acidobacteria bacterium]|nr:TonB-dependent receptor [Acidobacteriota bacterium]